MKTLFLSTICTLLILLELDAQIITDRPDQTESSFAVGAGNLQIESGFLLAFETNTRQILAPSTLFRYGVFDKIELRLVSQFEAFKVRERSYQGISDLEIGIKAQLFGNEESKTQIALLSHLVTPLGSQILTGDRFGTINKLCISHGINDNLGIGYNLGYDYLEEGRGSLTYSIALGVSVNDKIGVYIEPYGGVEELETFVLNADAGFTYLLHDNLQFDFSFGTGITHEMNYISIGVSWLMEKNK